MPQRPGIRPRIPYPVNVQKQGGGNQLFDFSNMDKLIHFMSQMKLMDRGEQRSMNIIKAQEESYGRGREHSAKLAGEENIKEHDRMMRRKLEDFILDILKDPDIERLTSTRNLLEYKGAEPGQLKRIDDMIHEKSVKLAEVMQPALAQGIKAIAPDDLALAIREQGIEETGAMARSAATRSTSLEQGKRAEDRLKLVDVPKQKLAEAEFEREGEEGLVETDPKKLLDIAHKKISFYTAQLSALKDDFSEEADAKKAEIFEQIKAITEEALGGKTPTSTGLDIEALRKIADAKGITLEQALQYYEDYKREYGTAIR